MYLLDTNIVSEIRKIGSGKADAALQYWAMRQKVDTFYLSVISVMEIQRGIHALERKDRPQASVLQQWLDHDVLPSFVGKILPVDQMTALICARLHVPKRRPANDAWIAATAIQHGLTLVTRNTADFAGMNIVLLNPFLSEDS